MINPEEIVRVYKKTGTKKAAAKALGVSRTTVKKYVAIAEGGGKKKPKRTSKTLTDFLSKYDDDLIIPRKIENGINDHLQGKDGPGWLLDREFREKCDVPVGKWRRYADDYKHLQVKVPGGELVWGHPDIIEDMRRAVNR